MDGVARWSERTELAICRQEKLLLEIRKSRFEMLCKTGLISTGMENRSQLKDALDAPTHRQDKYENEMSNQEIYDQIAQTLKKVKRIQ